MNAFWGVIPAAGQGVRLGGKRKALIPIRDRAMIFHAALALAREPRIAGLVVAVSPEDMEGAKKEMSYLPGAKKIQVLAGGATRQASVAACLAAIPDAEAEVLVHDGARPLLRKALLDRILDAAYDGASGLIPVIPVHDTVRYAENEVVLRTVDRRGLVAVQTPQRFHLELLRRLWKEKGGPDVTDDAQLLESSGLGLRTVPGDPANLKVTTEEDLALARVLLSGNLES